MTLAFHTNMVEGFDSVFKHGMRSVYQHCFERHPYRYGAKFDFRYSNRVRLGVKNAAYTVTALREIVGKRLIYRDSDRT